MKNNVQQYPGTYVRALLCFLHVYSFIDREVTAHMAVSANEQ